MENKIKKIKEGIEVLLCKYRDKANKTNDYDEKTTFFAILGALHEARDIVIKYYEDAT